VETMLTLLTGGPCDLDLKSSKSKINRIHVLFEKNQHVKCESSVINSSQENEWKLFFFYKSDLDL